MRRYLVCVLLLALAVGCKRSTPRALTYSAISILDGPNACTPATSFTGSFPGGLNCTTPAGSPLAVGASRLDYNFGGLSTALTASTHVHGYSLPTPLSATNRFLAVNTPDGRHWAYDTLRKTYGGIPGSSNAPIWDSATDELMYYASGAQWRRHNVLTGEDVLVADMSFAFHTISNGGSTHVSTDMFTTAYDEGTGNICATDLRSGRSYCASFKAPDVVSRVGWGFVDYTIATDIDSGTGQRYIMLMGSPALGIWTVDANAGVLRFLTRGGENPANQSFNNPSANGDGHCDPNENCLNAPHGDAVSIAGVQYFITNVDTVYDPCERDVVALKISDGEAMIPRRITIMPLAYCSSSYEWPDLHVGCSNKSGSCVLSTEIFHSPSSPVGNQLIYLPALDRAIKLAFHLSIPTGSDSYWFSSRAAISWDGRYIVYDSNSGQPDQGNGFSHEQVFLLPTPRRSGT